MTPLFSKLNLKEQPEIVVLGAPASFAPELDALAGVTIRRDLAGVQAVAFALAFVQSLAEVEMTAARLLPRAEGDAIVWFAYPKGTSKRYRCDFNRDNGWAAVGTAGFEPVRQVSIDADWSALRFRRVEFIKTMTRDAAHAASSKGKARVAKRDKKA